MLAGHNINRFDMKFLYRDCERYFGQTLTNDYIDTLKTGTALSAGTFASSSGGSGTVLRDFHGRGTPCIKRLPHEPAGF